MPGLTAMIRFSRLPVRRPGVKRRYYRCGWQTGANAGRLLPADVQPLTPITLVRPRR